MKSTANLSEWLLYASGTVLGASKSSLIKTEKIEVEGKLKASQVHLKLLESNLWEEEGPFEIKKKRKKMYL